MRAFAVVLAFFLVAPTTVSAGQGFYLKNGDRVVFYGDSITEQRLYTTFTESFVATRFPNMVVTFVHSGWGGDQVTGGGGGPIDLRLKRDVLAYQPTVMTIMLGMNDAGYQPFNEGLFNVYAKGYKHIVETVKAQAPGIRLTLIVPSPFDDVTRAPRFEGGYNAVLLRYGEFVKELAKQEGATVADLNTSVVAATKKAKEIDAKGAEALNFDRVHPGAGGQLLMAAALLKAWNAPADVCDVRIDAKKSGDLACTAKNATVTELKGDESSCSWTEHDQALPFPLNLKDSAVSLALKASDFADTLDRELLTVQGLKEGSYALSIDGAVVASYTDRELAAGVNLATVETPMLKQAQHVHQLTLRHNNVHFTRWRHVQVDLQGESSQHVEQAMAALDAIENEIVQIQRSQSQPRPHRFELRRK